VTHPGSYTTSSEAAGLKRIIKALNEVHRQTKGVAAKCLLENTAGQGSNLGWRFEHLATILGEVRDPERLGGICIDTCHTFAAGYAMSTEKEFKATLKQLDKVVGGTKAFHPNDSSEFGAASTGMRASAAARRSRGVPAVDERPPLPPHADVQTPATEDGEEPMRSICAYFAG
jgi:deoxyribonuclease-4